MFLLEKKLCVLSDDKPKDKWNREPRNRPKQTCLPIFDKCVKVP